MSDNDQGTKVEYGEHARHGAAGSFMSAVSQAACQTSWFTDLEYVLCDALEKADPRPFTAQQLLELHALVEAGRSGIRRDQRLRSRVSLDAWRDFNDAAPQADPFDIEPDPEQNAIFLDVVFGYCEG